MYDGEYFWHVPGHAIVGNTYQVKISSATYGNVFSLSEPFSIVTVLPPDKGTLVSGRYCMKRPAAALVQRESDEARAERQEHELKVARPNQVSYLPDARAIDRPKGQHARQCRRGAASQVVGAV